MTRKSEIVRNCSRPKSWPAALMGCFIIGGLLLVATSAAAGTSDQPCIKEQVGGNPPCTANDVRVGAIAVISGPDSCILGEEITVTMKATIESGPDRYDVGLWINESGGSAKSDPDGTCYRDYLPPPLESTSCNQDEGPYFNGEVAATGDTCGDVYAQNTDPCGNATNNADCTAAGVPNACCTGPGEGTCVIRPCSGGGGTCLFSFRTFTATFVCADSDADGIADVGTCTSWDNQVDDNCTSELGTDPGTGSKCSCSPDDAGIPVGNITICGNGVPEGSEECDDGTSNSDTTPDACRTHCTNPVCGDGVQDTGEQCDDGNVTNGDSCSDTCELECVVTGDDTDCDGVDDDCDGSIDEHYVPTNTTCGVGACAATGTLECIGGSEVDSCTAGTPSAETCDNVDNDCDGSTDEDLSRGTTCGVGACDGNTGTETCTAGTWGGDTCDPLGGATAETCDNLDNDCDGATDEELTRDSSCGAGECAATGTETCTAGAWGDDTCVEGTASAETCDNLDNDCDGATDEELTRDSSCGAGECAATGTETCTAGAWGDDTCVEGTASAETCDNLDNDCDGATDEELTRDSSCGAGECAATGTETCTAGAWGDDTCVEGTASAETCDNLDNDCDGATDEELTRDSSCGAGECAATGTETCTAGAWGDDTCVEGTASAETCDNLDNDCDGATDEELTRDSSCGAGECAATGTETCTAGAWGDDTCVEGTASAETCDNLDNDCDGATDEELTRDSSCGAGECAATGTETCTAGAWGDDTCVEGTASAETCDNLDNDCDGATDEELTRDSSCGAGECAATGTETCTAGAWGDDTCDANSTNGNECQDGDVCTSTGGAEGGADSCVAGTCTGEAIVCDESDVDGDGQCNTSVCNAGGVCEDQADNEAGECQDGDVCTSTGGAEGGADSCVAGTCTGEAIVCDESDVDGDGQCNTSVCNAGGVCEDQADNEAGECQDGDVCTSTGGAEGGADSCVAGTCTGEAIVCDESDVDGDGQCNTSVCNAGGVCEDVPYNVGGPCSDGDPCSSTYGLPCANEQEVCDESCGVDACNLFGECIGIPIDTDGDMTPDCSDQTEIFKMTLIGGVPYPLEIDWNFSLMGDDVNVSETLNTQTSNCVDGECNIDFGGIALTPDPVVYTVCENAMPAGWSASFSLDGMLLDSCDPATNGNPYGDIDCIYNPNALDSPPQDIGTRCVDFLVECDLDIADFSVTDTFPGGCPRTIGFWKNWNRCTNGGQEANADGNGGPLAGWFLLDDLLPVAIGDLDADTCEEGTYLLGKREVTGRHKKKANDAAYELASQLTAAVVNLTVGSKGIDPAECDGFSVIGLAVDANDLLVCGGFTGSGGYWPPKGPGASSDVCGEPGIADRAEALSLAAQLDAYNNGVLCGGCN